jgi:hypothetical protein
VLIRTVLSMVLSTVDDESKTQVRIVTAWAVNAMQFSTAKIPVVVSLSR